MFVEIQGEQGLPEIPALPQGRAANMSLLDPEEIAVVEAADARAPEIRMGTLALKVDPPVDEVKLTQTRHAFMFGFPIELNRFDRPGGEEDLEWYTARMKEHFDLAVLESSAKWARVEPERGAREFTRVDRDVAWAEQNGFLVKGHTLLWGIIPPFSTSGVPSWALTRYPTAELTPAEQAELRDSLESFIRDMVAHFKGRLAIWDVTNETLQPTAQWIVERLGDSIVVDAFAWAQEEDPDVQFVFNEWLREVFTGFDGPNARQVRDRVLELLEAGVPIGALGQQAHFTPAMAFAGIPVDFSQRTRIDDYARVLDTLAETGLPIHLTETNFIAPDEPEARAAQAEALLRLWWGHPSVEQIVFWGPWNKVAGRDEFDVGFWDDDRNPTRHGEAVFSLLNDRWRTNELIRVGKSGRAELQAVFGEYIAEWTVEGKPYYATFRFTAEGPKGVSLVTPIGR